MNNWLLMSGALLSSCITQCAIAGDGDFNAGADGQDVRFVFELQNNVGAHVNFNFIDYKSTAAISRDEIDFNHDPKFNLNSLDALLDWHPEESDFFVSGGAFTNRNKNPGIAQASFNPNTVIQSSVNKTASTYSTNGVFNTADSITVAPYLGLGWKTRHARKRGWRFSTDIGVMYHGRTTVSLENASCLIANSGAFGMCQKVDNGSAAGSMVDTRASGLNYVPVLRAGVSYVF